MTREEALAIVQSIKSDPNYYSNYAREKQCILRGMQVLAKYDDDLQVGSEHDQIYVNDFDTMVAVMNREDVVEMAVCHWYESEDSWSHAT